MELDRLSLLLLATRLLLSWMAQFISRFREHINSLVILKTKASIAGWEKEHRVRVSLRSSKQDNNWLYKTLKLSLFRTLPSMKTVSYSLIRALFHTNSWLIMFVLLSNYSRWESFPLNHCTIRCNRCLTGVLTCVDSVFWCNYFSQTLDWISGEELL